MTQQAPLESFPATPSPEIVASAATYYRVARYLIVVIFFVFGLWSLYDGYYRWPRENIQAVQGDPDRKLPHNHAGILINQILGVALPPGALLLLLWTLYNSRGAYRLANDTLHVPGHPPVPLSAIRSVDKRLWDRKGVAYVKYQLPNSQPNELCLDDFVYDRAPTDQIFDLVNQAAPSSPAVRAFAIAATPQSASTPPSPSPTQ